MFLNLLLLLLFCCINYIGTPLVTGTKGGNATLSSDFKDHEISNIVLFRWSKSILFCKNEKCKSEDGRVFKEGSYDIIIKDLRFSDAGKYILRVYYNNDQREVEPQEYYLHIHDEIFVKIDEKVKLDVLLINADKVQHQNSNNSEWTEVWKRGEEVQIERLTVSDGILTINNFTVNDTGIYQVLDSEGEILITVIVKITESSDESKGEADDTKQHKPWIIVVSVIGPLVVLALIIYAVIWIYKRQNRNAEPVPTQDIEDIELVPMQDTVLQNI